MRTIWLASTALMMSAGLALAQSSPTASTTAPAPTGSIASPQTAPQSASPGNMAPTSSPTGTQQLTPAPSAGGNGTTGGNGMTGDTGMTSGGDMTGSGTTGGTMTGSGTAGGGDMTGGSGGTAATTGSHHHWDHMGAMHHLPADATPAVYLHIAQAAIRHHNATLADEALSHAETRLLNRAVPQGQVGSDTSPVIQSIETARHALKSGDYESASAAVQQASGSVGGM